MNGIIVNRKKQIFPPIMRLANDIGQEKRLEVFSLSFISFTSLNLYSMESVSYVIPTKETKSN